MTKGIPLPSLPITRVILKKGKWSKSGISPGIIPPTAILLFLCIAVITVISVLPLRHAMRSLDKHLSTCSHKASTLKKKAGNVASEMPHNKKLPVSSSNLQTHKEQQKSIPAGFLYPVKGCFRLPDDPDLLPGAPRDYRYGVHQGIDFFAAPFTPVMAAQSGRVLLATKTYVEPSSVFRQAVIEECHRMGRTPPEMLFLLYGNFIMIEHNINGKRMLTVYAHLAPPGVVAARNLPAIKLDSGDPVMKGDVIGYVLNSGTSSAGTLEGTHLHFEIHHDFIGNYMGRGLSTPETRDLLSMAFTEHLGEKEAACASDTSEK